MQNLSSDKMVVLLSAGLDSTYNLFRARSEGQVVLALTFDYGQKAARQELIHSKAICDELQIPHQIVKLDFFKNFASSSLLNENLEVPQGARIQMDDLFVSKESAKSVWVPNRNGIFLNIGAGFAEALGAKYIVPGFNKEEAATFPDNSQQFIDTLNASFEYSTSNQVQIRCYSTDLDKTQIVKDFVQRGVNFSKLWPCYFSNVEICRQCESCQRFIRALSANGVSIDAI